MTRFVINNAWYVYVGQFISIVKKEEKENENYNLNTY